MRRVVTLRDGGTDDLEVPTDGGFIVAKGASRATLTPTSRTSECCEGSDPGAGFEVTLPPVRRALLSLPVMSFAALACNGKVARVECTDMLDRYIDMTVAGEPGFAELPAGEARAARELKKALRKGEPSYKRVQEQCEAEISRREYRCAMKAPTPETWQACID